MKTPRFWYRPVGLIALLLMPFGLFYSLGGAVRRFFAQPYKSKIPVICTGNIVAGGAGKTPTALAMAQLLKNKGHKPVFVTRGYGGSEKGPLRVEARHTASQVGDEALLLARSAPVFIGRDRTAAIKLAEQIGTHIILDDGLQNPFIIPTLAFLIVDGATGFGNNLIIPAGPLREHFKDAMNRITAVLLIGERDEHKVLRHANCPVLHAHLEPDLPDDFPEGQKFFAFAGIAHPSKFYQTCRSLGLALAATQDFPDHYAFTSADLKKLQQRAASLGARLLTTEKDWIRLPQDIRAQITALPVKLLFDDPETMGLLLQSSRMAAPRAPS